MIGVCVRRLIMAAARPRSHVWGLRPWTRHSLVLAVAGCAYIAIGFTYMLAEPAPSRESALQVALNIMDLQAWGLAWILIGCSAVLSSRWPPASETWGYAAMSGLAAWWACCYFGGVLFGAENQSTSGGLVWALVSFLWWSVAGLMNPRDLVCTACDRHAPEEDDLA